MRLHLCGIVTGCDGKIKLSLYMFFHSHTDFTFTCRKLERVLQGLLWMLAIRGFDKPIETSTICL